MPTTGNQRWAPTGLEHIMPTYTVTKIYKYSVTVEVEAEDERAAEQAAMAIDGEHNEDDQFYDVSVCVRHNT